MTAPPEPFFCDVCDRWHLLVAGQQLYDATDGNARAEAASRWEDLVGGYDRLSDSGGSSFLCDCPGVDSGVHESWCKSLGNPENAP